MNRKTKINKTMITDELLRYLYPILILSTFAFCNISFGNTNPEESDTAQYIEGIVRDSKTKSPVSAAQIKTLNHQAAATTDENGTFKIQVISTSDVLLVKAYDYNPREIPLRGRKNIEIDLYPESFKNLYPEIENVNGQVRASYSTNAAIELKDLGKSSVVTVDESLHSRMGGDIRSIANSGISSLGYTLFIRGLNSINLNAQPLLVVDGVIWNNFNNIQSLHRGYFINSLADIDLNDIESITVLKDGTSLYGSKGCNGVLVIKTKRGKDMATKIEVNAVGGITVKPVSLPVMNGDQFRIYTTDLLKTYDFLTEEEKNELRFLNDDPSLYYYEKYHNNTDWDKEVYTLGKTQSYNISVKGGDERAIHALSIGYTQNKGVVKTTEMQRLNTRFNSDFNLSDKIKIDLSLGFTNIDRKLLDDGVAYYTSPTYLAMIKAGFLNPYSYTTSGALTTDVEDSDDFGISNPSAIIENALNTNKHYRLNMSLKPKIQFTPHLSFSSHFDYSLDKMKESYYSPMIGVNEIYIDGYGLSQNVFKNQQMRNTELYNDSRIQYVRQFGNNHRLNAIAGWRFISNYLELDYAEGHNSGSDQKRRLLNEEEFKTTYGINNEIRSISNYASVDYSYNNRYFFSATLDIDGSSRFGSETKGGFKIFDHNWAVFPSVNASWLVSSENFLSGVSFVDLLKLRAGFGLSGNDEFSPYAGSTYFNPIQYMDRANGLIIANIANTEIQWETTSKISMGVEANLLNDRIAFIFDVYNNRTKDLLTLQQLPEIVGTGVYWSNGGELSNKGYEISANVIILNQNNIKWELGASIGHYKNNIESLPDDDIITSAYRANILTSVGNSAGVFYGYKTDGVFSTDADAKTANLKIIEDDGTEQYFSAGDIHFIEKSKDGIIDENDLQIIGDPNPDFYGSFKNKLTIWKFTIDAFFTFSYGNDIYNFLRAQLESGSNFMNQTTAMLTRWNYEGQVTNQPKVVYGDPMGNSRFSDRWIEDGSYLKLKSLTVNYNIPLKNNFIKGASVWISANNLFTLTNYLGRDPEISASKAVLLQGIDLGLIPNCKSYFMGIKLNL